jgi:predicted alpha/beta-fold hydrolase
MRCKLPDGEVLQLDWYPRHYRDLSADTPVVFFVPGLFGTSLDLYAFRFCQMLFDRLGWRSFVYNRRGFLSPVKGKQLISYNCFQDWRVVLASLRKTFPSAPVYLVGVSMGALNIQKYLIDHRSDPQVTAAVTISSPFDASKTHETIAKSRLLDYGVCQTMVGIFRDQLHHEEFIEHIARRGIDPQAAVQVKSSTEFHKRVTCKDLGHPEPSHFYDSLSSHRHIQHIQVPLLAVNSMDDPLIPSQSIPTEAIRSNPNIIQVLVGGGGHIEYFHGLRMEFWAYDLAIDYLKHTHESAHPPQNNLRTTECELP